MTSDETDRHLLLGLLAFQNGFVSKDQLLTAFGAWLANKLLRIDQLLVSQHAIKEEDRALLDRLVDQHLKRFAGDATQSLTRLSSIEDIRASMLQLAAADADAIKTLFRR